MAYVLSLLPYLTCPLGMSLMMWLMMRGTNSQATDTAPTLARDQASDGRHVARADDRLPALRGELAAVDAQIAAASGRSPAVETHEAAEMSPAGRWA